MAVFFLEPPWPAFFVLFVPTPAWPPLRSVACAPPPFSLVLDLPEDIVCGCLKKLGEKYCCCYCYDCCWCRGFVLWRSCDRSLLFLERLFEAPPAVCSLPDEAVAPVGSVMSSAVCAPPGLWCWAF